MKKLSINPATFSVNLIFTILGVIFLTLVYMIVTHANVVNLA
jgi:hypothetical protein